MNNYWDELMGTDEGAAQYMDTYGEGPGTETRHIIGAFINDGESVLDVGCGPGWNYDHFLAHGPVVSEYLGLDYSSRFVRVANQRHPDKYQMGDCRKLMQSEDSWDVVILQDCLEHTSGYKEPIMEALRVAKKRVIITFWKASFQDDNSSEDQINDDGNDGYGATYNRTNFENYLDLLGYHWLTTETTPAANRWHRYYVIDKEGIK
jgi:ubiquinone/menaquinone biosynthesis C-methylase UbiE